ncbi:MAG TPA: M14/M99 family metallopeptidase, partial [Desulfatiglandales bacterium]|nr:M14/M99 family metallopeptidase [Desulfatiglandales bacterium]
MDLRLRSAIRLAFVFLTIIETFLSPCSSHAQTRRENLVYFPNTAYELNIYKIYGKTPGKTLMLIGGIQGNEPGGLLSADLYADMSLSKGNLIVAPRANFYSILLNQRGYHGDMNRKFANKPEEESIDDKIVSILKGLIAESDYLLNLHDGSGYYYPEHISKWRNPEAFGQSIIADCEEYKVPDQNKALKLGEIARKVVEEINCEITDDLHKFHFNNTRTDEPGSIHREQLKSATYYALTKHHIPAFGIETSKFLPSIDLKVRYHNLAINSFMKLFDIVPEQPSLFLDTPELKYLVVAKNGQTPILIRDKQTLNVTAGDKINIAHVEANYERGLSVDILGYGSLNDFRKDFLIYGDTSVIIRKDNKVFSQIPIRVSEKRTDNNKPLGEMVSHFAV